MKRLTIYGSLFTIIALVLIAVAVLPTYTHSAPLSAAPAVTPTTPAPLHQDPQVVALMQSLGLDYSKLNLVYGQAPNAPDSATGMFVAPDTLYVKPGSTSSWTNTVVSHEYIHYIQTDVDTSGSTSFYPYLDQLVTTDTWLNNRMAWHRDHECPPNNCHLENEYEAIACTEMPDRALHADFVAWCNKYLPKRYSLSL